MTDGDHLPANVLERLERSEQLKLAGKNVEALAILEDLIVEDPTNVAALEEIADNELSLDHVDRAEAAALQAITLDRRSYTGHYILGYLHSRCGQWEQALAELRETNRLHANNPEILRALGWALFKGGQRLQGVVTLERSLNLDHDSTLTLCDLGVAYLELHHVPKAKALFLRALALEPGNCRARECVDAVERMEKQMKVTGNVE